MIVRAPTREELARLAPPNVTLRPVPLISCKNMFPSEDRIKNMRVACYERHLPDMLELEFAEIGREGVIVGGGPSADKYLDKIRSLNDDPDYCIIVIERMLSWCLANKIQPEYVLALDASSDVVEALQTPPSYARYLIAMQCESAVLDCLKHNEVYLFQTPQKELESTMSVERQGMTLNTGGSVVLGAISAAMALGIKSLHVFGFDCHVTNGSYAKNITGVGGQSDFITVRIEDRDFKTTLPYLAFAQQFFLLTQFGRDDDLLDSIKIYGDSLINAMSKEDLRG